MEDDPPSGSPPHHVRDLPSYRDWLAELIEQNGHEVDTPFRIDLVPNDPPYERLIVLDQRVRLWSPRCDMNVHLLVDVDLIAARYSYQFVDLGGRLICRLCKNAGHVEDDGVETHYHYRTRFRERRRPCGEFNLAQAIDYARKVADEPRSSRR